VNIFIEAHFLPSFDQLICDQIINLGINIGHITSKWLENVIGPLIIELLLNLGVQSLNLLVKTIFNVYWSIN
jgi:hypothetical protein